MKAIIRTEDLINSLKCVGLNISKERNYGEFATFQDKIAIRAFSDFGVEFIAHSMFRIGTSESHYMTLSVLLNSPQDTELMDCSNEFVVNYQKVLAIADSISSDRVIIESDTKDFSLVDNRNPKRGGKGKAENTDMFPIHTWLDNLSSYHMVDALQFRDNIQKVMFAIAPKDEVRSALQTVLLELDHAAGYGDRQEYSLITADGRRMCLQKGELIKSPFSQHDKNDYYFVNEEKKNCLKEKPVVTELNVPGKTMVLLGKLLAHCKNGSQLIIKSAGDKVNFFFRNNVLEFQLSSTVNVNKFPNYKQVVPSYSPYSLEVDTKEVTSILKKHLKYVEKIEKIENLSDDACTMTFLQSVYNDQNENILRIRSGYQEDCLFDEILFVDKCGHIENADFVFQKDLKTKYLLECIENSGDKVCKLNFNDNKNDPLVVMNENEDYLCVTMPIKIKEGETRNWS